VDSGNIIVRSCLLRIDPSLVTWQPRSRHAGEGLRPSSVVRRRHSGASPAGSEYRRRADELDRSCKLPDDLVAALPEGAAVRRRLAARRPGARKSPPSLLQVMEDRQAGCPATLGGLCHDGGCAQTVFPSCLAAGGWQTIAFASGGRPRHWLRRRRAAVAVECGYRVKPETSFASGGHNATVAWRALRPNMGPTAPPRTDAAGPPESPLNGAVSHILGAIDTGVERCSACAVTGSDSFVWPTCFFLPACYSFDPGRTCRLARGAGLFYLYPPNSFWAAPSPASRRDRPHHVERADRSPPPRRRRAGRAFRRANVAAIQSLIARSEAVARVVPAVPALLLRKEAGAPPSGRGRSRPAASTIKACASHTIRMPQPWSTKCYDGRRAHRCIRVARRAPFPHIHSVTQLCRPRIAFRAGRPSSCWA